MKKILTFTSILAASAGIASANIDFTGTDYTLVSMTQLSYDATWGNRGFVQGGQDGDLVLKGLPNSGDTSPGRGGFSFQLDLSSANSVGTGNVITAVSIPNSGTATTANGWGFYLKSNSQTSKTELVLAQMNVNGTAVTIADQNSKCTVVWDDITKGNTYDISVTTKGGRDNDNFSVVVSSSNASNSTSSKTTSAAGFGLNGDKFGSLVLGAATSGPQGTLKNLSIIPEPSMFGVLAGLGALALVGARRRRK